jgi:hypothetical protein
MAEVRKHGLIRDNEYFARAADRSFVTLNEDERVSLIHRSLEIKAAIAAADPFERGERKLHLHFIFILSIFILSRINRGSPRISTTAGGGTERRFAQNRRFWR